MSTAVIWHRAQFLRFDRRKAETSRFNGDFTTNCDKSNDRSGVESGICEVMQMILCHPRLYYRWNYKVRLIARKQLVWYGF